MLEPVSALHLEHRYLEQFVSHVLGAGAGVVCRNPIGNTDSLYPTEMEAIQRSVAKRKREFAAGRSAVRSAMALLGLSEWPIPKGQDGAPVWPAGLIGSISHCDDACIAAVATMEKYLSIGIDIEKNTPIEPDLWETICSPEDQFRPENASAAKTGHSVTLLFCAKEAAYKCWYPHIRQLLDFSDIAVQIEPDWRHFQAILAPQHRLRGLPHILEGHLTSSCRFVLALTTLPVFGATDSKERDDR